MPLPLFALLPPWPHRVDRGLLLLMAGLFLATILAHRYWRAVIRLEDELETQKRDEARARERYQLAFRAMPYPAAFVDRVTGLVMEAAPGWELAGLPSKGTLLHAGEGALEAAWRAIPAPDAEHRPAAPVDLEIGGRVFRAEPLGGASLGVVMVVLKG